MWSFYIDLTFTPLQGAVCWLMASDFENALFDIEDRVTDQKVEDCLRDEKSGGFYAYSQY